MTPTWLPPTTHIYTHITLLSFAFVFLSHPPSAYTYVYICKMQQTCWGVSSIRQRLISEVIVSSFLEFWLAYTLSLLPLKMSWTQEFLSSESPSSRLVPQVRDLCSGSHRLRVPREVHAALDIIASAGPILLTLVFICLFFFYFLRASLRGHPCKFLHQIIKVFSDILRESQAYRRKWEFLIDCFFCELEFGSFLLQLYSLSLSCSVVWKVYWMYPKISEIDFSLRIK